MYKYKLCTFYVPTYLFSACSLLNLPLKTNELIKSLVQSPDHAIIFYYTSSKRAVGEQELLPNFMFAVKELIKRKLNTLNLSARPHNMPTMILLLG